MRCYSCKHELRPGQEFCSRCGAPQGFDLALIEAAEEEDPEALKELYQRSLDSTYFTVRGLIRDEDAVFRILESSYVLAFRNLDRLQDAAKFLPWMQTIARNRCIEYLQQADPAVFTETDEERSALLQWEDDRSEPLPDVLLERKSAVRMINQILDAMPNSQRVPAALYYCDRVNLPAIAAKLGLSESAVISRLIHARQRIEARVEPLRRSGQFPELSSIGFFRLMLRSREASYASVQVEALFDRILLGMAEREKIVRSRRSKLHVSRSAVTLAVAAVLVIGLLAAAFHLLRQRNAPALSPAPGEAGEEVVVALEETEPVILQTPEEQAALTHPLVLQRMESFSYLDMSIEYPVFLGAHSEAVNSFIRSWVEQTARPVDPDDPGATHIAYRSSVTLLSDQLVSIVFYGETGAAGMAYPLSQIHPITLDHETMQQLELSTLYNNGDPGFYEAFFNSAVYPTRPATSFTVDSFAEALALVRSSGGDSSTWTRFYLKQGALVLSMDTPHASGCDHFEGQVSYDDVISYFKWPYPAEAFADIRHAAGD